MTSVPAKGSSELERIILLILAAVLLNVGLFIVLVVFAPLIAGLVVAYLLGEPKRGTLVGFVGAILSYSGIMLVTEYLTGFSTDPVIILSSVLLMGVIGSAGGFVGGWIRTRTK